MKKKLIQSLFISIIFLLLVAPQAFAVYIKIDKNGNMNFYQTSVLGDDDEEDEEDHEEDDENEDEDDHDEEKDDDDENKTQKPIKRVSSRAKKTLNVKAEDNNVRIELNSSDGDIDDEDEDFEDIEYLKTKRLELEYSEKINEEIEEKEKKRLEEFTEERKQYFERLREDRKQRYEEMVELRNKIEEGKQVLELETRNVKATLSQGATFTLNPETNETIIITPSGNEHTLYHLPDQSILEMQNSGLLSLTNEENEHEIEIDIKDDGTVLYKVEDFKTKKFLGIFNRNIPTQVTLDDSTGEVKEIEVENEDESFFEKILDSLSF